MSEANFQSYYNGTLSTDERAVMEDLLSKDAELNANYQIFLASKKTGLLSQRDKLRSDLDEIYKPKLQPAYTKWVVALLVFLSLLLALWYFMANTTSSSEQTNTLYAQHFELFSPSLTRSTDGIKGELKQLYLEKDYNAVLSYIDPDNTEHLMMKASILLEQAKYNEAIIVLEKLPETSIYRDQKYWYLGLASLALNDKKSAIDYLSKLKDLSNYKKRDVEAILKSLEK